MNESFSHEFNTKINSSIIDKWELDRRSGPLDSGPHFATSKSLSFPK